MTETCRVRRGASCVNHAAAAKGRSASEVGSGSALVAQCIALPHCILPFSVGADPACTLIVRAGQLVPMSLRIAPTVSVSVRVPL